MRKWIGLLASLVVILASFYIMGFILKSTLNKNVASLSKAPILSVKLDDYQQGWFSSRALLAIKMHIPEQTVTGADGSRKITPPVDFVLGFPLSITHGPFIFTDFGIRFGIGQASTLPQTHYNVLVNYFNNTQFQYTFPSFSFKEQISSENLQFEWKGFSAFFSLSPAIDKIDGDFALYGLNGSVKNIWFNLGKVTDNYKITHIQDGLWLGSNHLSIPSFTLNERDKKIFYLDGFEWMVDSDIVDDLLTINWDLSVNQLIIADKTYGPGVLRAHLKNLDPEVLAKINQSQWSMLQNSHGSKLPMLALFTDLPKLFSKGSELEISELTFVVPEGKITGQFKIGLPQSDFRTPEQMLRKVHGEGQFRAPIAVVRRLIVASIEENLKKHTATPVADAASTQGSVTTLPAPPITSDATSQADDLLKKYVNKGLLKVEGNDYVILFKLENQQLMVNGQPFTPAMLQ